MSRVLAVRLRAAAVVALLGLARVSGAQSAPACTPSDASRRIEQRLQQLIDSVVRTTPDVPGVALTVLAPARCVAWSGAAGVIDRTTRTPLTPVVPHRMASNTKTYTAAAILRLMEEGRLSLDDPMTRHLPAEALAPLRRDGYDVDHITLRHLLTHTAGIYDYAMDEHFVYIVTHDPLHRWTRAEQVDSAMVWGQPYGAPGALFHYTDTGYILLGQIVERLTAQPMAAAFRSLLHFEALGLSSTWLETMEPRPAGVPDLVHQYMGEVDTRGIDPSFDLYGGGGLAATTLDMARFTRALFAGGVFSRPSTIQAMITLPTGIVSERVYALGIGRAVVGGHMAWGHTGFWNTFSRHFPAEDITIAGSVTQQERNALSRALEQAVMAIVTP